MLCCLLCFAVWLGSVHGALGAQQLSASDYYAYIGTQAGDNPPFANAQVSLSLSLLRFATSLFPLCPFLCPFASLPSLLLRLSAD